MTARFIDLPLGRISENEIVRGFLGSDFLNKAFFSDSAIVVFGVSGDKDEAGLVVLEGKFTYPNGRATGVISSFYSSSLWTEESQGYTSIDAKVGGHFWRYALPAGTKTTVEQLLDPIGWQNASKIELSPVMVSQGNISAATDIELQISQRIGQDFANKYVGIVKKWISSPFTFDINKTSGTAGGLNSGGTDIPKQINTTLTQSYSDKSQIDPITNFDPKFQRISIDSDPFGISGDYEVDFRITKSSKQLKKLQKSDFNLIYNRKDGSLYYNANREEVGFGDRGGLIAVLNPKLPLTAANFEVF